MSVRQLGIFARYWQPGRVKTRLAAQLGDVPTARLYRRFVTTLVQRLGSLADRHVLAVTPAESIPEFASLAGDRWLVEPQSAGGLGARMQDYFQRALHSGADRVVLIGSDSPTLPERYVAMAFDMLREHRVVLGPAIDGGYYLLGAAGWIPPIFDNIAFGTASAFDQTTGRLATVGCPFGRLPEWYDVDTPDDLRRLQAELECGRLLDERQPGLRPPDRYASLRAALDEISFGSHPPPAR